MTHTPPDPLNLARACAQANTPAAIATVVGTWGSSPRPCGSMLFVDANGHVEGSVSGGCVETDVVLAAQDAMTDSTPRLLNYGVTSEQAWEVGLACGGKLAVFVQPIVRDGTASLSPRILEELGTLAHARRGAVLVTTIPEGRVTLVTTDTPTDTLPDALHAPLKQVFATGASTLVEHPDERRWFLHAFIPKPRLIIVGAVHIAQALGPIAVQSGFDVIVVDPRTQLATAARFPGMPLVTEWPDDALNTLGIDAQTAIVTLTHDPKLDDPALIAALRSPAFYIGALGSRKTQASRLERLREDGFDDATIARLRGPVGLAIGGIGAPEIALSVLAEIVAVRRKGALGERQGW